MQEASSEKVLGPRVRYILTIRHSGSDVIRHMAMGY